MQTYTGIIHKLDDKGATIKFDDGSYQAFEHFGAPILHGDEVVVYKRDSFGVIEAASEKHGDWMVIIPGEYSELKRELHSIEVQLGRWKSFLSGGSYGKAYTRRISKLSKPLYDRMWRFIKDAGGLKEFFIDNMGEYELFCCEQAQVLLDAVESRQEELTNKLVFAAGYDTAQSPQEVLEQWWGLNSKPHEYNYELQHQLIPEWSDGHSGNTAGGAYSLAMHILDGRSV